jgi:sterol desaturase/sphingolipid hydroxylase (fatty acid hydroxylase superfamily)
MSTTPFSFAIPLAVTLYVFLLVHDAVRPARAVPRIGRWRLKGILFFGIAAALHNVVGIFFDPTGAGSLLHVRALGGLPAFAIGFVTLNLAGYAWHRARHASPLLWRVSHQLHHASEAHDAFGSFIFHPLDTLGVALLGNVVNHVILGVGLDAGFAIAGLGLALTAFTHANLRTPRWLGYVVARPESHALHHERGVHRRNYADLPLIDMIFGTFENAREAPAATGFYDGASTRVAEMLVAFRDVSVPRPAGR